MQKVKRHDWFGELTDKKYFKGVNANGTPVEFWYVERNFLEVTARTVLKLHDLPIAFSEWWSFWNMRYEAANSHRFSSDIADRDLLVKVPLITDKECYSFGL